MAVSALKSAQITNLNTIPVVRNTTGVNAEGPSRISDGFVTAVVSDSLGSTYKLVRLPSNAKVKAVHFESEAQGAGKVDLSVYYSDSTVDGTQPSLQGVIVPTTGSQFFASIIDCAAAVAVIDVTNESGNYTLNKRNQPLWQALGLAADPGGFFDVVAVVATTAITTGTGRLGARVTYVM